MLRKSQVSTENYLIKQLPTATAYIDREFRVVHVSDAWIQTFEFDNIDVFGKSIFQLFESVNPELKSVLEACLVGSTGTYGTKHFIDRSGNERWFEWQNIPWFDADENIIGLIIQATEITERRMEQEQMDRMSLLLKNKSEVARIGSWEYHALSGELKWCPMICEIKGIPIGYKPSVEEAINFYKEGHSRNTIAMAVDNAMEKGESWNEKLQMVTADGREIWVIAAGKPIYREGEIIGIIGTLQDITEHVLQEAKIRESEELLRMVIDSLPLNVYIKDSESRKILVNRSECEYLGVKSKSELLHKSDFELYDKDIAQISRDEDLSVLRTLVPMMNRETINIKRNGDATTFLTSKIPLIGRNGKAEKLLGISLDISELKQKEEELHNLINVTSLQNKKLVNFAHIVSHNLRSHTANFSMLLDFLKEEQDEQEKENLVNMLTHASDNLLETIDNLNEVVSINTNVNLKKTPVNLAEKINTIQHGLSAFLKNNEAQIVNLVKEDIEVPVIPAYLDSILMNFITNAVKYRHPERAPKVLLSVERLDGFAILSITDNGLGIDLDKYGEKLFGMYKTFHDNAEARGIGLYITKNQIEAMNGKVDVSSEIGKGTTFYIYFNEEN